jgi:hypothetical protein
MSSAIPYFENIVLLMMLMSPEQAKEAMSAAIPSFELAFLPLLLLLSQE